MMVQHRWMVVLGVVTCCLLQIHADHAEHADHVDGRQNSGKIKEDGCPMGSYKVVRFCKLCRLICPDQAGTWESCDNFCPEFERDDQTSENPADDYQPSAVALRISENDENTRMNYLFLLFLVVPAVVLGAFVVWRYRNKRRSMNQEFNFTGCIWAKPPSLESIPMDPLQLPEANCLPRPPLNLPNPSDPAESPLMADDSDVSDPTPNAASTICVSSRLSPVGTRNDSHEARSPIPTAKKKYRKCETHPDSSLCKPDESTLTMGLNIPSELTDRLSHPSQECPFQLQQDLLEHYHRKQLIIQQDMFPAEVHREQNSYHPQSVPQFQRGHCECSKNVTPSQRPISRSQPEGSVPHTSNSCLQNNEESDLKLPPIGRPQNRTHHMVQPRHHVDNRLDETHTVTHLAMTSAQATSDDESATKILITGSFELLPKTTDESFPASN